MVRQAGISERQQAEKRQRSLYSITEKSVTAGSLERFYADVHSIVGELLYARNFYIALLSSDGEHIEFPYSVDERDLSRESRPLARSEEHTSELQSLMRISYAVFCLKKKKSNSQRTKQNTQHKHERETT